MSATEQSFHYVCLECKNGFNILVRQKGTKIITVADADMAILTKSEKTLESGGEIGPCPARPLSGVHILVYGELEDPDPRFSDQEDQPGETDL